MRKEPPTESASTLATLIHALDGICGPPLPQELLDSYILFICPCEQDQESFLHLSKIRVGLTRAIIEAKLALQADATKQLSKSPGPKSMATTQTVDRFIAEIANIVRAKNAPQLKDFLIIEPPYSQLYSEMITELQQAYPKGKEDVLEAKCSLLFSHLSEGEDTQWTAFTKFMVQYCCFLRDVDLRNLLDTYNLLAELVQKCNSALGHATLGIIVLPTVVSYSQMLSRLAIGLDKQPELIAHLATQSSDESGGRETLPERAANIIRQAFVVCLNDRTGTLQEMRNGQPEGKKVGIYKIANLCLKVLFQCRKTRNAEQIFVNIYNQSPPLSIYPRAERVTYLYYLGRFLFSNSHFYRAHLALQAAYDQCHGKCLQQRRLILIYLISTNLIMGRFPNKILERPEAAGLAEKFLPICHAIKLGDLATFQKLTSPGNANAAWFRHYRILLQIENRCQGNVALRKAPNLGLEDVLHLAITLQEKGSSGNQSWAHNSNYIDQDLDGVEDICAPSVKPDMLEIESIFSSLIDQGLLRGFISHRQLRFAITGGKHIGALAAGFPNIWNTIRERSDDEVPGWKKDAQPSDGTGAAKFGPGMVVNLSGVRPVTSR